MGFPDLQMIGYGWAGLLRRYLVDPVEMWWPANLAQVSLFRCDFFLCFINVRLVADEKVV